MYCLLGVTCIEGIGEAEGSMNNCQTVCFHCSSGRNGTSRSSYCSSGGNSCHR